MTTVRVNYAIVFVSNMARSVAFYRDVVGLSLRFESSHWTEFATEGATLALHVTEAEEGVRREKEAAGSCRPGFSVPSLDRFHERMLDAKVRCVQTPENVFGARLAQYADPDGLTFSVGEAAPRS